MPPLRVLAGRRGVAGPSVGEVMGRVLRIQGMSVRGVQMGPGGLVVVQVRPRQRKPRCGVCGRPAPGYDTKPGRLWRHLALGETIFWLRYAPRRVRCREHGVRVERVAWAAHGSSFTHAFEELVAWQAQRLDKSSICRLLGINWRTVGTIIERLVEERLSPGRLAGLQVIGVDELGWRAGHQYVSLVVDHLRSRVVWVAEGKNEETLNGFFDELGEERTKELTHATMDLSAAFSKAVGNRAPHVRKVFDRFHVQKLANEALDTVRRQQVREQAGSQEGKALKHSRWALLKNPWNLTVRQGEKLSELKKTNQTLYRAYLLKESLARGMDYVQPKRASEHLDKWCQWASHSRLAPFAKLAKTVQRHKDGILAYVETGLSNGVVEGINNKIRALIRRAYGFRNPKAFRAMILLCCGGMEFTPPLPVAA
ncbi:ISL3 family transposase [Archangium violaceum]|uniref:ISL3 family transposase n=1 Tax=Archangium violaceum TaxID=83451 RepID=UPI00193B77F6|nr:ISL3 family transposase [Archangium violaceum]QRK08256.1 ISL3 family transposase [Archangium violaceum]